MCWRRSSMQHLRTPQQRGHCAASSVFILVYPMLNAPGRAGGGWRGSFALGTSGEDANRHFVETQTGLQIVDVPKAAMTIDRAALRQHGRSTVTAPTDRAGQRSLMLACRRAAHSGRSLRRHSGSRSSTRATVIPASSSTCAPGASPSITIETGDPSPVTDAEIAAFGVAVVSALAR